MVMVMVMVMVTGTAKVKVRVEDVAVVMVNLVHVEEPENLMEVVVVLETSEQKDNPKNNLSATTS